MYRFNYLKAENKSEVLNNIEIFLNNDEKPQLLEIFTPRELNDEILSKYFASIC